MKNIDRRALAVLFAGAALFTAACGKGEKTEGGKKEEAHETEGGKKEESHETEGGSGKVIVVETYSDEKGNYYKPSEIEAHKGDVIRYTLKSGVHNVHFLADSNPGKTGLPPASEMLQLPGQTYDLKVTFDKGKYYFQCDPHVALGMKGHLEVQD